LEIRCSLFELYQIDDKSQKIEIKKQDQAFQSGEDKEKCCGAAVTTNEEEGKRNRDKGERNKAQRKG